MDGFKNSTRTKYYTGGLKPAPADLNLIRSEINDMGSMDRARASKMLGNAPGATVVKKTTTVVAPKRAAPSAGMTPAEKRMVGIENNEMGVYKKGGAVKTANALRAQKYKAAMASRPNRKPVIGPDAAYKVGQELGKAIAKQVKPSAGASPAAGGSDMAAQLASALGSAGAGAPAAPAAPMGAPMGMGAPAMKKGGKVSKRQDGGMATSIRPTKDYNASDKDFVSARAEQLKGMVGKAEGGKADLKQDKAMIKAMIHKHERNDHPGKPLTKLRKGGAAC